MKTIKILSMIAILFSMMACKENKKKEEIQKVLEEWVGKEIKFPENVQYRVVDCDSADFDLYNSDYKILLYSDSTGCTSCKLQLGHWNHLINDAKTLLGEKLSFLFYLQPKQKEDLDDMLRMSYFEYPVFYDVDDEINKLNKFLENDSYRCFLLDKNNKVVMIGNPVINPKIWELYKQEIAGNQTKKQTITTTVQADNKTWNFGDIDLNGEYEANFTISNIGENNLVINNVLATCGCTTPEWEKQPVRPGQATDITVKYKPDKKGFFSKQIDVFCNTPDNVIRLSITGNVN